jgi:hypothetical protein
MQIGAYECFDEPLTEDELKFVDRLNRLFNPPGSPMEYAKPAIRLIYKPFNRIPYEYEGQKKEDYNSDLPDYKYSLGWKVTIPEAKDMIKEDMPPGMKRAINKVFSRMSDQDYYNPDNPKGAYRLPIKK